MIADAMNGRRRAALKELCKLIKDKNNAPINYNHYYTDTIHKKRVERIEAQKKKSRADQTSPKEDESSVSHDSSELDSDEEPSKN